VGPGGSLGGLWGPVEPGMSLLWLLRRAALCLLVSYMPLARLPRGKKRASLPLKHHLASQIWVSYWFWPLAAARLRFGAKLD
jgi:hypothetical protein